MSVKEGNPQRLVQGTDPAGTQNDLVLSIQGNPTGIPVPISGAISVTIPDPLNVHIFSTAPAAANVAVAIALAPPAIRATKVAGAGATICPY